MIRGTLNPQSCLTRALTLMVLAALVFAIWHVSLHDLDVASDANGHGECQVCRLNHVPVTDLPVSSWIVPLFVISLLLIVPVFQRPTQSYRYRLRARAPPLF